VLVNRDLYRKTGSDIQKQIISPTVTSRAVKGLTGIDLKTTEFVKSTALADIILHSHVDNRHPG
jgi:hypothetical protein